jgi:hypothetical protein
MKEKADLNKKLATGEKNLAVSRPSRGFLSLEVDLDLSRTCLRMPTLFEPK